MRRAATIVLTLAACLLTLTATPGCATLEDRQEAKEAAVAAATASEQRLQQTIDVVADLREQIAQGQAQREQLPEAESSRLDAVIDGLVVTLEEVERVLPDIRDAATRAREHAESLDPNASQAEFIATNVQHGAEEASRWLPVGASQIALLIGTLAGGVAAFERDRKARRRAEEAEAERLRAEHAIEMGRRAVEGVRQSGVLTNATPEQMATLKRVQGRQGREFVDELLAG
jgi:hypothetical protein